MSEFRGFTCDGGCGENVVISNHDSLARVGWFTTFTPTGMNTIHTCSADCLVKALSKFSRAIK